MINREKLNLSLLDTIAIDIGCDSVCNVVTFFYILNQIENKHFNLKREHGDIYQLVMVSLKIGKIINECYKFVSPDFKNSRISVEMCIDSTYDFIKSDSDEVIFISNEIDLDKLYKEFRVAKIDEIFNGQG